MKFLAPLLIALTLAPSLAYADTWVPYNDGRPGGCWYSPPPQNIMWGCT